LKKENKGYFMEEDCNDPTLCSSCSNMGEWPICIDSTVTMRGYHSIFKEENMFDIVKCSNYEPLS